MEESEIECYRRAGEIVKKVKDFAKEYVKRGMKLVEIAEAIENKIIKLSAVPAFPVNLSLNEIAAHFTPRLNDETIADGLLKIDIGVCVDGFIGDSAITIDLTEDKRFSKMIKLNQDILEVASSIVKNGVEIRDIGNAIARKLDEFNLKNETNFTIVHNLTGHGLEKNTIHAGPNIPNYSNNNSRQLEGAFAIEPFITEGSGEIYEGKGGNIYILQEDRQVREKDMRAVLDFIKLNYEARPFCIRWLEKQGFKKLDFVLGQLVKQGILHHYPLLIEKTKSPVCQFENSFIVDGSLVECLTG